MARKEGEYTVEERNIILKVYAIALGLMECRYWHETEETSNYLTQHDVEEGHIATFNLVSDSISDYVSTWIEEMFCFSQHYEMYEGSMTDIVNGNFDSVREACNHFLDNPTLAVSKPKYVGGWSDKYEWAEGQYLDPEGLLHYLERTIDHDLDIEEVSKLFQIGDYEYLREETKEVASG